MNAIFGCYGCTTEWTRDDGERCPACGDVASYSTWSATVAGGGSNQTKRAQILDKAKEYVTKDRNATHGEPEDTFGVIAGLWSAYLGAEVSPADVCNLMVLLKVARAKANPLHDDSFVDIAGYAACGAEVAK